MHKYSLRYILPLVFALTLVLLVPFLAQAHNWGSHASNSAPVPVYNAFYSGVRALSNNYTGNYKQAVLQTASNGKVTVFSSGNTNVKTNNFCTGACVGNTKSFRNANGTYNTITYRAQPSNSSSPISYTTSSCPGGTTKAQLNGTTTCCPSQFVKTVTTGTGKGAQTTTTCVFPPPSPTASIACSPNSVTAGRSATISWSCGNSSSYAGTNFSTGNRALGYATVRPTRSTTYTIACSSATSRAINTCGVNYINSAPSAPTVTGSTSGKLNTNYTFTFRSTDPDGNPIKYGLDWNNNGVVDAWVPSSGYVPSASARSAPRSWTAVGSKPFQVKAYDSKGASSRWSSYSISIVNPAPTLPLLSGTCVINRNNTYSFKSTDDNNLYYDIDFNNNGIDFRLPPSGTTAQNVWKSVNYTGWTTQGRKVLRARATDQYGKTLGWKNYSVTCTTSCTAPVVCNGGAPSKTLLASPSLVLSGGTTKIKWSLKNVSTCSIKGVDRDGATVDNWGWGIVGAQTQKTTSVITQETKYTLSCTDFNGKKTNDSITVKLAPKWLQL